MTRIKTKKVRLMTVARILVAPVMVIPRFV